VDAPLPGADAEYRKARLAHAALGNAEGGAHPARSQPTAAGA
jgi:hypothetical protein